MRTRLGTFVLTVAATSFLMLVSVWYDLTVHAWLRDAAHGWKWWNYLTTVHTVTMATIQYGWFGFIVVDLATSLLIWLLVARPKKT